MPATTIAISRGNNQAQGIAGQFLIPLEVLVTDGSGTPVQGTTVNFAVASYPSGATGQAVSAASATTGSDGKASVVATMGNKAGTYTFTATSTGLTGSPLTFTELGLAIVSLQEAKDYLAFATTTNDSVLLEFIGDVTNLIESRMAQPVCPRTLESILDGSGDMFLYMDKGRILEVLPDPTTGDVLDSLQVRPDAEVAWTQVVEDSRLIFLNPVEDWRIQLLNYRIFPLGYRNIRVYGTFGFNAIILGDVKKMAKEMIQVMWDESKASGSPRLGKGSGSRGAVGTSASDGLIDLDTTRWQKVFDRYRRLI